MSSAASVSPARRRAFEILMAIDRGRTDLGHQLASPRTLALEARDHALVAELATGTLRWRAELDFLLETTSRRAGGTLEPAVRTILRLAAYQLRHLSRVPASAAVNEAVELAKATGHRKAAGFVNAVLRQMIRRGSIPLPGREEPLDYLATTLSHPRWLAARWLARYGFDQAEAWEQFNNRPAPLVLRANRLRIARDQLAARLEAENIRTEATAFAPDGLIVQEGPALQSPLYQQGFFFVQDEASQLVALAAGARPGERVFDACAAPGGKTTQLAWALEKSLDLQGSPPAEFPPAPDSARLADSPSTSTGETQASDFRGLLVAMDLRSPRVAVLRRAVEAGGSSLTHVVQGDLLMPPVRPVFDCVLVDVPCSGLGTIRRDPEVRWRRREEDLARLAAAELALLTRASSRVRRGGRLIYATCSSEPDENDAVVARFLDEHPDFRLQHLRETMTPTARAVIDADGCLRTTPVAHGLDAFFASALARAG